MLFLFSVPDPPSNLRKKSEGTSYIEVHWDEPVGGKDSYKLRYKKTSELDISYQSRSIAKELTAYQIDTLNAGETYDIGIKTISGTEESSYTNTQITTGKSIPKVNLDFVFNLILRCLIISNAPHIYFVFSFHILKWNVIKRTMNNLLQSLQLCQKSS